MEDSALLSLMWSHWGQGLNRIVEKSNIKNLIKLNSSLVTGPTPGLRRESNTGLTVLETAVTEPLRE